ncbi:hypothetical protein Pmani_020612 [Petrolisthes manimaculis]|uniref:Uncharacterized protein n=1 Tax=Petrolisthes manimaculis TaxID=1843537 RepID=A0AAE1PFC4_9EUCA|nr:hypothetical protein Pmani_020612 [Petrolisthes manimaculis]
MPHHCQTHLFPAGPQIYPPPPSPHPLVPVPSGNFDPFGFHLPPGTPIFRKFSLCLLAPFIGKRSQHRAIHRSVRVACQPHLASPMEYLSTVQHFSPLSPAPLAWVMGGTSCTKLTEMDYSALPVEEL